MRRLLLRCGVPLSLALVTVAAPVGHATAEADWSPTTVVTTWNAALIASLDATGIAGGIAGESSAIVQASVFDAVNSVQHRYAPYHFTQSAPPGTSAVAAAAGAAHEALGHFFPTRQAIFDALLPATLPQLHGPDNTSPAIERGLAWGAAVADDTIAWRANDGFTTTPPPYTPSSDPGRWQPAPPAFAGPVFRQLATETPFAMTSPTQFRPGPPPALSSDEWATDFNETKLMGESGSLVRDATQTQTARFWASETPAALWNRVADTLIDSHGLSLARASQLLAVQNIAMADSAIAVWDAKNYYDRWRPITAIRAADTDGNDATDADPTWTPLLGTPPHQEYPSGHSGASSAAATVLAAFFGNDTSFTVTSDLMPGVSRSFTTFDAAVEQVADARVFAGIHFRFSCDTAAAMGAALANYVMATQALPRNSDA